MGNIEISYISSMKYKIGAKSRIRNILISISILSILLMAIIGARDLLINGLGIEILSFLKEINLAVIGILFVIAIFGVLFSILLNNSIKKLEPDDILFREIEKDTDEALIEIDNSNIYITIEDKASKRDINKLISNVNRHKNNKFIYSVVNSNGSEIIVKYLEPEE